jgi:hypothetical protein
MFWNGSVNGDVIVQANDRQQRNAQGSTGPRTVMGRSRSRLNTLKHGLAIPASALPAFDKDVAHLARAIAGDAEDNALQSCPVSS